MRKVVFSVLLLIFLPCLARAAHFSPVFTSALEFGGDNLVNLTYSDGSTSNIEAGRGILLGAGVDVDLTGTTPHRFEAQLTGGMKWTSTQKATNGEVDWYRFPIEFMSFYRNMEKDFRVGGGLVYQIGNQLSGTKEAAVVSTHFDNAIGFVLQGDWILGPEKNIGIGIRYTGITYKAQVAGASMVKGSSLGMCFEYFWF